MPAAFSNVTTGPSITGRLGTRAIYLINCWSIAGINPSGIIPKSTPVDYTAPRDRARLAGT
jgi:hypothetical protein